MSSDTYHLAYREGWNDAMRNQEEVVKAAVEAEPTRACVRIDNLPNGPTPPVLGDRVRAFQAWGTPVPDAVQGTLVTCLDSCAPIPGRPHCVEIPNFGRAHFARVRPVLCPSCGHAQRGDA